MPEKWDQDSAPGIKLLKVFRKLLLNGRRYYQADLAREYCCSPQTIIRIMADIESVIGTSLETGLDNKRKWYRIGSENPKNLGLDYEELRYLSVCRDLASQTLPEQILSRVDDTIFNLSLRMTDKNMESNAEKNQSSVITFFSKGRIDYSSKFTLIEKLMKAIEQKLVCLVRYKAAGASEIKEFRFIPHRLAGMNQALYVLGATLDEDYETVKHCINFAVHRLQDVILTEKKLEIAFPAVSAQHFGLPWHEPRVFCIHFKAGKAADYVSERIWSENQKIEKMGNEDIILRIESCSEPELMAWVRSFGEEAWIEGNGCLP